MKHFVTLMTGTNNRNGKKLLKGVFRNLSFWSDNLETVAHYYEGCVIELVVELDLDQKMDYVRNIQDFVHTNIQEPKYTFGFEEVKYPQGAKWYSFSNTYLNSYVISIKEIFPDLTKYNDD